MEVLHVYQVKIGYVFTSLEVIPFEGFFSEKQPCVWILEKSCGVIHSICDALRHLEMFFGYVLDE